MFDRVQHNNLVAETISAILVSKNLTQAAELLCVNRTTLYKRFQAHPEIKEIAAMVQTYSQNALKLASARAVNVLINNLDNISPQMRMNAAKEILDRVGLTKENSKNTSPSQVDTGCPMELEFNIEKVKEEEKQETIK